jgi:hypothetical protein
MKTTIRKTALFFLAVGLTVGLAAAAAHSYTVTLFEKATVGTTELAAGQYRLEVGDQKAIIRRGKIQSEIPVRIEEGPTTYDVTSMRLVNTDGKQRVQVIYLGGTKTKLVVL